MRASMLEVAVRARRGDLLSCWAASHEDDGAAPAARGRAAVFLDKDGTLVEDVPYNVDPARLRFTPHALEALALLSAAGLPLVVVSNQPGLATGRFDRADLARLQRALIARLHAEAGVTLAGFHVCPHAPGDGGRPACTCRKPAPGLLRQAAHAHGIDLARSTMVGDILDDIEAAHRAGCAAVLLDVGNETEWRDAPLRRPDHRAPDLLAAARWILARHERYARDDAASAHTVTGA
jgi:D-glycero-D-manno-heptose 1,7-bisphosphate phosphatase